MLTSIRRIALLSAATLIAACPAFAAPHAGSQTLHATLHDRSGADVGEVTLRQEKKGVLFVVKAHGLTPGMHGLHIHSVGKCDAPDFKTSGGHFALAGEEHGFKNPKGPHLGDLPNLDVKADGTAKFHYVNKLVTLSEGPNSLLKAGGTALVIHAGPDDEMSNPSGNSGGRVACAVLSK